MLYSALDDAWRDLVAAGGEFELERVPVRGRMCTVFKAAPRSVRELWLSTQQFGDREYLIFDQDRLTYTQTHRHVRCLASWLHAQGLRAGDRVAIAMRNFPEWIEIYWSCMSIGLTVVGFNSWWVPDEIEFALQDAQPRAIFCDDERLARLNQCAGPLPTIVVAVRCEAPAGVVAWADLAESDAAMPTVDIDPDADACIFYTSGTTGRPKGAVLTHRSCVTNLWNLRFAARVQQRAAAIAGAPITAPAIPAALITTPLFHVSANNCSAYQATYAGGKIVLMYKWDAGAAVRLIEQERITSVRGVPVMSREILHHPDFAKADRSSLISMGGGGAPLPPDLVLRISDCDVIPSTAYGLTETSGIISAVDAAFFADKPTSVGRVMPTFEARIVDDNGADAALGSHGELWVRGAAVFKEYLNRPEATEEALTDGWFHTGDIARIDTEGFLHIVDRKKDMVLRGGENISCAEVEACLYRDDAVAECAVFGVPDERLGEEVGVAVYPVKGVETSAQALRELCLSSMARHKCPRYIWFVDEPLPRNANGKFLKRQIRSALRLQNAQ